MSGHFPPPFHRSFLRGLRSWLFTGLVVFGPVAVTAYIAWWVIDTIDNWVRPWLPNTLSPDGYLPFHVSGFGVLIAIVGFTLLGFLTANFIGCSLVQFGEAMLDRTPLIRGVHKVLKQVFETIFSRFMPCTPKPTTGFCFDIPADRVIELPISAHGAAKLNMSAGVIQPQGQAALAAMAKAVKLAKPATATEASGAGPQKAGLRRRGICLCVLSEPRNCCPSLDAVSALKLCYEAAGVNLAAKLPFGSPLPRRGPASDSCDTHGATASI